jgi:lauroyl/myristoyl acyltransferase
MTNEIHRIEAMFRQFFALPPRLKVNYSREDYFNFFKNETEIYSKKYAKERVIIHSTSEIVELTRKKGAVLAPIHHGSFFLSGGVFVHQLGLNCNAVVTHNNLLVLPPEQAKIWRAMHKAVERLHGQNLFYAGINKKSEIVDYLSLPRNLLWAMLDVREAGRPRPEYPFFFQGNTIYIQTGSAQLACSAGVPFVPIGIKYNPINKVHDLFIGAAITPSADPIKMTQAALQQIEKFTDKNSSQLFHDMDFFSAPAGLTGVGNSR